MNIDGSGVRMLSNGKGRTTCAYFFRDGKRILYSSTHASESRLPAEARLFARICMGGLSGLRHLQRQRRRIRSEAALTKTPGYDAEATISPNGKKIVFTSVRDGDLDIYTMDIDGKNVRRLTNEVGYDGGPFFSYDSEWIVYRAHHPKSEKDVADYRALLKENLIRPTRSRYG